MFRRILLAFTDSELRIKILKIIGLLILARLLTHIPIPLLGVQDISNIIDNDQVFGLLNTISGGAYGNLSFVMLGVGPFITASIVMQLLGVIVPSIRELQREGGDIGQQKINRWTRVLTIPLGALSAWGILQFLSAGTADGVSIDLPEVLTTGEINAATAWAWFVVISSMVAGSVVMMYIGEIITEYKMGNGVSLMILSGIVVRLPSSIGNLWGSTWPNIQQLFSSFTFEKALNLEVWKAFLWQNSTWEPFRFFVMFVSIFLATLVLVVFVNDAVRKLTVIYTRRGHTEGKSRMLSSVKADLPMKVNMAGVLPIIFAVSFILFPTILSRFFITANIQSVQDAATSIEQFLSTEQQQAFAAGPLPNKTLDVYYTGSAEEIANANAFDQTIGEDLFGFTISTLKEDTVGDYNVKNSFFEGTFLNFEFGSWNPGFLPEFAIRWDGVLAYTFFYFLLIVFFTYFYTSTVAFKTDDVAENLQKSGAYVPGFRPGVQTMEYLSYISNRLNVAGSIFLAVIALVPLMLSNNLGLVDSSLSGIVGGTTLLILVSVTIETLKQIEAQATAVDYERFTKY